MKIYTADRHISLNERVATADFLMDDNSKLSSDAPPAKVLFKAKRDNQITILNRLQELYISVCFI